MPKCRATIIHKVIRICAHSFRSPKKRTRHVKIPPHKQDDHHVYSRAHTNVVHSPMLEHNQPDTSNIQLNRVASEAAYSKLQERCTPHIPQKPKNQTNTQSARESNQVPPCRTKCIYTQLSRGNAASRDPNTRVCVVCFVMAEEAHNAKRDDGGSWVVYIVVSAQIIYA